MKILQKKIKHKTSIFSKSLKGTALALLFLISFSNTQAQQIELAPTIGYFWAGTFRTYNYNYELGQGLNWGLTLDWSVNPGTQFEAFWTMSRTDGERYVYGGFSDSDKDFKLTTNYIHVGVLQEMNYGEAFRPFGVFTMGTTIFSPENDGSYWQFSLGLGGGIKYYVSDNIGIRLQGRFLLPVYWGGGYYYYGGYYGSSTAIAQGDASFGLIFVLQ